MSQIMQDLVVKNSATPMIITEKNLIKLTPAARTAAIKEEIMKIARSGNVDHLEAILNAVFNDPSIAFIGGIGFEMGTVQSMRSIDSRVNTFIARKMQELASMNRDSEFKDIMNIIHEKLSKGDGFNAPNAVTFSRENIGFSLHYFKLIIYSGLEKIEKDESGVYATKYIPPFFMRYKWRGGMYTVHKFPEAIIGVKIFQTGIKDKLGFDSEPRVLQKNHYKHPYVWSSNKICIGNFNGSEDEKAIAKMPFLKGVWYFLNQVAQIIMNGYHERTSPAFHHLNSEVYDEFLMKEFTSPEIESEILARQAGQSIRNEIVTTIDSIRKRGELIY